MLKLNKEYSYREICEELDWKICTSNDTTKQKQIKTIESSFEWYHPENKKTHKPKKSYIFTRQLQEPFLEDGRKNNGAENLFPQHEFDYLLSCIIHTGKQMNHYYERDTIAVRGDIDNITIENSKKIYVSNALIYKEFGFDVYKVFSEITWHEKGAEVLDIFKRICIDSVKSQTITKICKKWDMQKTHFQKEF